MSDTSTEPEDEFSFWRTCPHEQHPLVRDLRQGRHAIASVIRGHRRLQMLCSDGGLGKNHLVESVARECGIGRQDIVFMLPISVASLYLALWRARDAKFTGAKLNFLYRAVLVV